MRTSSLLPGWWAWPVLVVAALAVGCGVDAGAEYTPATKRLSSSPTLPREQPTEILPAEPEPAPAPIPGMVNVDFVPLIDSPMTAHARLTSVGALTRVSARISAGAKGITYESSIRQGRCDRLGPQVFNLNPVTADSLGRGSATSDAVVGLDELIGREHVVVFGPRARPEICGEIGS